MAAVTKIKAKLTKYLMCKNVRFLQTRAKWTNKLHCTQLSQSNNDRITKSGNPGSFYLVFLPVGMTFSPIPLKLSDGC